MKRLCVCFALLVCPACLMGCKAGQPKSFDEAMVLIDKVQTIAEKHNLSWSGDLDWNGRAEVYWGTQAGLDSGVAVKIHLQGNTRPLAETID